MNIKTKTKTITKGKKIWSGRTYRYNDGNYFSVTSVINPEGINFPPELLVQYSARGTIVHNMWEHFMKHYRVPLPEEVADPELIAKVTEGSEGLKIEDCNFQGFYQEYGDRFETAYVEKEVRNTIYKYAGRLDGLGLYIGDLAVMDVKTAGNYDQEKLNNYWMQQAAYAKCITPTPECMVIIPLNPKSERGYDEPIVERDVDRYFEMFLKQLAYVKETYAVPE